MHDHSAADAWRARLRHALTAAMRERRVRDVKTLRSALAAVDNAEAVEAPTAVAPTTGGFAKSVRGLGASEARRRTLTEADVLAVLRSEAADRRAAADDLRAHGEQDRAAELGEGAALLERLIAES